MEGNVEAVKILLENDADIEDDDVPNPLLLKKV